MSESLSAYGAHTPTLALPTRGWGKGAWFRAMDSLPLRCAPAGNDTERVTLRLKLAVIPPILRIGPASAAREGDRLQDKAPSSFPSASLWL